MALNVQFFKRRRIQLVSFERATTGDPIIDKPDPDVRGFATPEFGAVLPMKENTSVFVRVRRLMVDNSVELFVKVGSGPLTLPRPEDAKLSGAEVQLIQIQAAAGGNPTTGTIEIHQGSLTGPLIARLTVFVFSKLTLRITPHNVTIRSATAAGIASSVDINSVIDLVRAVWAPCGLELTVGATKSDSHQFAVAGRMNTNAELKKVLKDGFVPNTINAYFVRTIVGSTPGTLGVGLSRAFINANGFPQPGIVLGDTNVGGTVRDSDSMWLANDLAHEIGHFLQLPHTENLEPPNEREDLWSRRRLMHNFNTLPGAGAIRDQVGYGTNPAGSVRRGCFVTMKDLTQLNSDGEAKIVRATVLSPAGPT